jgi:carbon-monoxide dehydrogenase medium subunit
MARDAGGGGQVMIPAAFSYARPASLSEALSLLAGASEGTKVISGGQSLLPLLRLRMAQVDRLVDIGRLPELRGIRPGADGGLVVGAAVPYAEVLGSALVAERVPLLVEVIHDIGDVQVRNLGTLGGSLAHVDPASDLPAAALALDASVVARSTGGERVVPVSALFAGPFESTLAQGELITEIRFPGMAAGTGAAYRSITQPASGYSIVGVAAVVAVSGGRVATARVGITGVGEVPYRATAVEDLVVAGGAAAVGSAAAHAADGQDVNGDIHADAEYRTAMAAAITRRALEAAFAAVG